VTAAPLPLVALAVMFDGTPWSAKSLSVTVTVNVLVAVDGVSSASLAVHVTFVTPTGKTLPGLWSQVTVGLSPPSSLAAGGVKLTGAPAAVVAVAETFGAVAIARSVSLVELQITVAVAVASPASQTPLPLAS
jgi:hypothetical protein